MFTLWTLLWVFKHVLISLTSFKDIQRKLFRLIKMCSNKTDSKVHNVNICLMYFLFWVVWTRRHILCCHCFSTLP